MTLYNGDLIVAGRFTTAGGSPANRIALGRLFVARVGRWIQQRRPVISPVYNGELIAGGFFSLSGATQVKGIARWNGSSWQSLAGGLNPGGYIESMTVFGSDLLAAGFTTRAAMQYGGRCTLERNDVATVRNAVLRRHQTHGLQRRRVRLQPPLERLGLGRHERQHVQHGPRVRVSGRPPGIGYFPATSGWGVARRVGASWQQLGGTMDSDVVALTTYNGELIAAGFFDTVGGLVVNKMRAASMLNSAIRFDSGR